MRTFAIAAFVAATLPVAALPAQSPPLPDNTHVTDPHQPANDGSAAASASVAPGEVAPGVDPGTAMANARVNGDIAATNTVNANNDAQYQSDLANYDAAMRSHDRASMRYARQKRAYADAMAAWRLQAAACARGKTVACNAPAPDPANFY